MTELVSTRLSAMERAHRYREFARETLRLAEASDKPALRTTYITLSSCWANLAHEAESAAGPDPERVLGE